MELFSTLKVFIFFTLFIILTQYSNCVLPTPSENELQEECNSWNQYCERARAENNPRFQCLNDVIYFYESVPTEWDESRHVCSLKFDGSYFADLVQIPDNQKLNTIKMLESLGDEVKESKEIATGGACCMKKLDQFNYGIECNWLSSGIKVSTEFVTPRSSDRCQIITIAYNGTHLRGTASQEKSSAKLPFLCSYSLPDKCQPIRQINQTTVSVVKRTQTPTPAPQTKPTNYSKGTTPSTQTDSTEIHITNDLDIVESRILLDLSRKLKTFLDENMNKDNSLFTITMEVKAKIEEHSKTGNKVIEKSGLFEYINEYVLKNIN